MSTYPTAESKRYELDQIVDEAFKVNTTTFLQKCIEKYNTDCLFIWSVEEAPLADVLVESLIKNDESTERQISRISLLNIALYCGLLDKAKDLYESSKFNHDQMCNALMRALIMAKANFVELSTEFHFDFDKFLTVERLYQLYQCTVHKGRVINICAAIGINLSVDCNCETLTKGDTLTKVLKNAVPITGTSCPQHRCQVDQYVNTFGTVHY